MNLRSSPWIPALRSFVFFTLLTGAAYPLLVTGISQIGLAGPANGSLIEAQGRLIGSRWIAQKTERPEHFWPRPSAADYATLASGASNLGPTSQTLKSQVEERRRKGLSHDLLFTSGSGLDPHVSPEASIDQVPRILDALSISTGDRDTAAKELKQLIEDHTEGRQWGVFGEPRVNVLELNLSLDAWAMRKRLK